MKKNLFLTLCFSMIPGAGQMYQGYMKRGGSLLIVLIILAMIAVATSPIMLIPMLGLFAFSFFDTFNLRNNIGTPKEIEDNYIWCSKDIFDSNIKFNMNKRHVLLGIVSILFGAYILLNSVIYDLSYNIPVLKLPTRLLANYLPQIIIAFICIYIGTKFISKKDK